MHPLVFVLLALVGVGFVFGVVRRSLVADAERIENELWRRGLRVVSCRYSPCGPGLWTQWSGRKYAVVFEDAQGVRWHAHFATSLWNHARRFTTPRQVGAARPEGMNHEY